MLVDSVSSLYLLAMRPDEERPQTPQMVMVGPYPVEIHKKLLPSRQSVVNLAI